MVYCGFRKYVFHHDLLVEAYKRNIECKQPYKKHTKTA